MEEDNYVLSVEDDATYVIYGFAHWPSASVWMIPGTES